MGKTKISTRSFRRSFYTPTKSVRINNDVQNNDPNLSRIMVTGVLNNSANQSKKVNKKSQSQTASNERHTVARKLFTPDEGDTCTLSMPHALTASLPIFDEDDRDFGMFRRTLP